VSIDFDLERRGDIPVLRARGELGEQEGLELVHAVSQALDGPGDRVIIDFSETPTVNSGGLGAMVRVQAQANTQEQNVVFAALPPFVLAVLQTTRLDSFLSISPTVQEALATLGKAAPK